MKVKELDKTVNLAWSPAAHTPVMLAAGTAAQQLDASFSTSATLDIYDLNLNEPGLDMELKSSIQSKYRFHKLVWGPCGSGVIVGGCDDGHLQMYNAASVLTGDEGLLCAPNRHAGAVRSIDFNPFQANLLASGASDSEIFIWDLNNVNTPMTPGAKSQPAEEVVWLSWNKQVQHILASSFATRCVVWDLRKNEPIIKLSDSNSRVRWKVVAWHPDVATQLCLASEEDSNPVIQLWDLRFATAPIKTLEGHNKGVLSIAWCDQDPDLLISCGKDSRILCWNPTASQEEEILCEIVTSNQWNFEVIWCPRNPSLIATSSFDGHASVFALVGGQQQMQTTNKIADSFPGMEQYAEAPQVQPQPHSHVALDLRKAPKWLKRPAGASFCFGGKLVSFSNGCESGVVHVSQVVTDPSLVERSRQLQQLVSTGQLRNICHGKSDSVWSFVAASLEPDCRMAMRTLLGFNEQQLLVSRALDSENKNQSSFNEPEKNCIECSPFKIMIGEDKEGMICRALLAGNIEQAVDLCVKEGRMTDAIILATCVGPDVLARTQLKYFQQNQSCLSYLVSAVVSRDWSQVISCCDLSSWAEALAVILTYASDDQFPTLCERLGDRLEKEGDLDSRRNSEICFVAAGQLGHLIQNRVTSDISNEILQELVELVLVAGRGEVHDSESAQLMGRYSQLLAAQGDFITALNYLTTSLKTHNQNNAQSRFAANYPQQQPSVLSQQGSRTSVTAFPPSARHHPSATTPPRKPSITNPLVSSFQPGGSSLPPNAAFSTTGLQNSFSSSTLLSSLQPSFPNHSQISHPSQTPGNIFTPPSSAFVPPQKPQQTSNYPPQLPVCNTPLHFNPDQVPPPPSSFSALQRSSPSPSIGGSSRKYIVDPSVGGSKLSFNYPQPQPAPYNMLQSQAAPPQLSSTAVQNTSSQSNMPSYNNITSQQNSNYNDFGSQYHVQPSFNSYHEQPFNPTSNSQPERKLQQFAPQTPAAPGWNDPPTLSSSKRNQIKEVHQPPPITHPLFATGSQDTPLMGGPPEQTDMNVNDMGYGYGFSQAGMPPPTFVPPAPAPALVPVSAPTAVAPPRPKPKPALPEEHLYLKTVFDELRSRCTDTANNPQLRRKLEDVSRKLEMLYEALAENKMSPRTLSSLHEVVQLVQTGDYSRALQLHTQLISGNDFAQISAFMPGLKVLIQSALQLGVYLQ